MIEDMAVLHITETELARDIASLLDRVQAGQKRAPELAQKPWILPIPGTTKLHRLDEKAVEKEISRVREEIERMEAERKSLINRVDFATLTVKLVEDYKAQLQMAPDSAFTRFHNAGVEGYKSLVEGVVQVALFLLSYGPSVLFWSALLFFPARFLWKKSQRHTADFRLPRDS